MITLKFGHLRSEAEQVFHMPLSQRAIEAAPTVNMGFVCIVLLCRSSPNDRIRRNFWDGSLEQTIIMRIHFK